MPGRYSVPANEPSIYSTMIYEWSQYWKKSSLKKKIVGWMWEWVVFRAAQNWNNLCSIYAKFLYHDYGLAVEKKKNIVFQFLKKLWKGALIPIHMHLPKLSTRHLFNKSHRFWFQFSFYSTHFGKSINLASNYITISHVQTILTGCITVPLLAFTSFFIASNHVSEMQRKHFNSNLNSHNQLHNRAQ